MRNRFVTRDVEDGIDIKHENFYYAFQHARKLAESNNTQVEVYFDRNNPDLPMIGLATCTKYTEEISINLIRCVNNNISYLERLDKDLEVIGQ